MPTPTGRACPAPAVYHRRCPERTLLYRLVQTHLIHGFVRARCSDFGYDFIVAYSCKGRGVCPSCTTRRMAKTAAHLVDHVFPRLAVRQWVLSFPKRLRCHLDAAELQNAVLHSFLHTIERCLRQARADALGENKTRIGAVVFIHRFGGLLNAHLHYHAVVIDGVFFGEDAETLRFEEVRLTPEAVQRRQATIRKRIVGLFVRRGLLDKADGEVMCGCEHGGGFSLDTSVRIEANDRQGLERLLRYCARSAFAQKRLRQIDAKHLVYESPKPGPGGRVSQILTPLELMDRLAELIPPPRRHRHRYYCVLAPNSPLRPVVTAMAAPPPAEAEPVEKESFASRSAPPGGADPFVQPMPAFEFDQRIAWKRRFSSTPAGVSVPEAGFYAAPEENGRKFSIDDEQAGRR